MINEEIIELLKEEHRLHTEYIKSMKGANIFEIFFDYNNGIGGIIGEMHDATDKVNTAIPDRNIRIFYRCFIKELLSENFEKCQQLKNCIEEMESNNVVVVCKK